MVEQKIQLVYYDYEISQKDRVGDSNFAEEVLKEFGRRYFRGTALTRKSERMYITKEPYLRKLMERIKPSNIVEIGTWRGVMAAFLAHYAESLITVDVREYAECIPLWMFFGVNSKITRIIIDNEQGKHDVLYDRDFDFAFIDGMHKYDSVKHDFDCVKKCGRVLFHDYGTKESPGVTRFIDTLPKDELTIDVPFAYWEKR